MFPFKMLYCTLLKSVNYLCSVSSDDEKLFLFLVLAFQKRWSDILAEIYPSRVLAHKTAIYVVQRLPGCARETLFTYHSTWAEIDIDG